MGILSTVKNFMGFDDEYEDYEDENIEEYDEEEEESLSLIHI